MTLRPSCAFCGCSDAEPEWYHKAGLREYGRGMHNEEVEVCGFCYNSHAASRWLAGNPAPPTDHVERDQLMIANILRLEARRHR